VEEGLPAYHAIAALGIVAVLAYTYYVIKPFQKHG
jgi:hypothetical protein